MGEALSHPSPTFLWWVWLEKCANKLQEFNVILWKYKQTNKQTQNFPPCHNIASFTAASSEYFVFWYCHKSNTEWNIPENLYFKTFMRERVKVSFRCDSVLPGYGLDVRNSIPGRKRQFFSSPTGPNRLWDPTSLPSKEYRKLFPME